MTRHRQLIRAEQPGDEPAIRRVQLAAFPTPAESQLVDNLRSADRLTISLVALLENEIVGHIAFSPVTIEAATNGDTINSTATSAGGLGLAPLAVLPDHQRSGIGTALGHAGMAECRRLQTPFVVVLGSPDYYPRFGFSAAARWKLLDEYEGGPAFQAIELVAGAIPAGGGLVRYAPEFAVFAPDA
jgi:putative acetyltransferase